jgi:hypothetical protein
MKDRIKLPSWAQGVLAVGAVAALATLAIRAAKRKDEKEVEDLVFSTQANPFNWREFFTNVPKGTTVVRYVDGGEAAAKRLYNMFGFTNEEEQAILAFFAGIKTQYQVAQVAKKMFEIHKIELSTLLIEGRNYWLPNIAGGLSKDEVATIYKNVKAKPRYK